MKMISVFIAGTREKRFLSSAPHAAIDLPIPPWSESYRIKFPSLVCGLRCFGDAARTGSHGHYTRKPLKTYILIRGGSIIENWHVPCKSKPRDCLWHH